jgi:hypothetical protein
MKKFFTVFFVTLGIIFFILLLAGGYFFMTRSPNLTPMLRGADTGEATTTSTYPDKNPILSPSQEKALETFGIDPATVPSSITPEQESCVTKILGKERVAEIRAGEVPTAAEYFKAKSCI